MPRLPKKIKIAGLDIEIKEDTSAAHSIERWGEFDEHTLRITLEKNTPTPYLKADTLIHEINHAVWWVYNIKEGDDEERIVNTLSSGVFQVYRDNPDILLYIQSMIKEGNDKC